MSDYVIVSPFVAPGPVTEVHTAPKAAIGLEVDAIDRAPGTDNVGAGRFVYARGSNVASGGQFCHLINGSAVLLAAANSASAYPIGSSHSPLKRNSSTSGSSRRTSLHWSR